MIRRQCSAALAVVLVLLLVAACGGSTTDTGSSTEAPPEAVVSVTPDPGATEIDPLAPVRVATSEGTLTSVTMTNEQGNDVDGVFTPDRTAWKPTEPLGYGRTYTITAATDRNAEPTTSTFTTLAPNNQTKVYFHTTGGTALSPQGTFGVGTVVVAHFDENVPDRATAERHLSVTTDPPVTGSWYWLDDRNAHWRPQNYYEPGTRVTLAADIYGKDLGGGLYGQEDTKTSFTIGPSHVSIVDDTTKQVQVYENGTLVRTMPTSMGRGGSEEVAGKTISFWTQPGVYTVMDKANPVVMDSSTYGLPVNSRLGYKETIGWATRISTDGIYLHQLDDTIWAQGNTNVSHGCLNLSGENARWFYEFSQPGDVVEIRNTGGAPLEVWQNGDWSVPWDQWLAGSALR
ncbi:L,D-transpeptidase [Nocardia caishijiensis]|uniref:Lipoprotein-anchoring transpeptidase ErfK/SrfK n=1 Tax=Nocardia caishijiensis TaxID=184756 RepID=A0ABQ6YJV8_9NOCA|nr:Ig-like domain-containing protein [Nocardia caishijiensis]KAF0846082.1 lipoprotein-anchoring transpeptidase ErfK/SrfK [Nocardia caishijiensis]